MLTTVPRQWMLRTKSAVYVLLLIAIIFTTTSVLVYTSVHREMLDQLGDENIRLVNSLATGAAGPLLLKDLGGLTELMQRVHENPAVRSAEIVDMRGIVIASTNLSQLGQNHPQAAALIQRFQATQNFALLKSPPPCCPLREVLYAPIAVDKNLLGIAYLHMDGKQLTQVVSKRLDDTLKRLLLLGVVTALLGIIGAFIISGFVTRPILHLAREMEKMKARLQLPRQNSGPIPQPKGDEIALLQEGFQQLEQRLNQYLDELEQLHRKQQAIQCLATIGEMSAQVAHEIRNALSSLRGASRFLARFAPSGDKQEFVQIIEEEVQRLYDMTEGFLDFGRPYKPFPTTVDIGSLIQHTVQRHANDLEHKAIHLHVHCEDNLQLCLDGSLIEQALSNLLLNAIDAVHEGGRIHIDAFAEGTQQVAFSIADNGPGIDPARAQEVFKPYITSKVKGSGLGLAVVSKIAMVHDGHVELRPSERGAHFVLHVRSLVANNVPYNETANSHR